MCFCAQGNNYRGMVLSEKGRDAVFENEPQPDARHASESTTFKWCACLRWRRLPTLTAACSEALKLAGAEGSELVSLGRCSPVTPLPSLSSPWLRILRRTSARGTAMHTDRTIPGWQARQHIPDDAVRLLRPSASKGSRCSREVAGSRERLRCPESIAGLESLAQAKLG